MYQSELNQRSGRSRTCVLWDLSQGIGLVDCGDWLGRSHVHRASCQKGSCQAAVHRGNFFFFGKASAVLLRSFNWMNQAHWDYLKQSPLFKNPHALWMLITFTKYLDTTFSTNVWQTIRKSSQIKSTYTVYHHIDLLCPPFGMQSQEGSLVKVTLR